MPRFEDRDRSAAIGARLCIARLMTGRSLADLAGEIGMSFQQVQKYERGTSRLPAIMLDRLGRLLDRPALFFIETDHTTLARMALLERPKLGVMSRQFDRAVDTLRRVDRTPAEAAGPSASGERAVA